MTIECKTSLQYPITGRQPATFVAFSSGPEHDRLLVPATDPHPRHPPTPIQGCVQIMGHILSLSLRPPVQHGLFSSPPSNVKVATITLNSSTSSSTMDVTTHIVAPHTHLARHNSLVGSLDAIFREHRFPPAILQHTFTDRRPTMHYTELVNLLTPFPTQPTSEFLEDIGRVVAPAQTRFTTLMSSHYPPVFPPIPATTLYAVPNEDKFIVARSSLQPVRNQDSTIAPPVHGFTSEFESTLVMDSDFTDQVRATLKASFFVKTNPDKPSTATLTIGCPSYSIHPGRFQSGTTGRHAYVLHSLSATARQDPSAPTPYELTPHFTPRDPRFERMCNGLRYECTWAWEVLDAGLRTTGVGTGADFHHLGAKTTGESGKCGGAPAVSKPDSGVVRLPKEHITVTVPLSAASQPNPLHITFTATLTSAEGLDAIDAVHRTGQWADRTALERLQHAFDSAHPAIQVMHHVVRIYIPDVGEVVRAGLAQEGGALGGLQGERIGGTMAEGIYASMPRPNAYSGEVCVSLDRDAGVVGRRGDEDEEGNSDEDE